MCDIDRAVEVATQQDFLAFTEGHPYPADYEPEPEPIYCAVCGDVAVENKGNACDRCINSDDDDMRTMAWAIRERDAVMGGLPRFTEERAEVGRG